ncbi:MAG: hypothetical protein J6T10_21430 [Methanobrevibacter sp.]|nr:hypothetical protein [Methanobrevibacter sp.]
MRTRLIICDFDLDERDVYQFKSLIDQESGELLNYNDLLNQPESTMFFFNSLDIFFSYFTSFLIDSGYKCIASSLDLKSGQFCYVRSNGNCKSISICIKQNIVIHLIEFKAKFGLDFDSLENNLKLIDYAQKHWRLGKSLGADAFKEFLDTVFKCKNQFITQELIREMWPVFKYPREFQKAKDIVAGLQVVKSGHYDTVYDYDIESAYPAQMLNYIPVGLPKTFTNLDEIPKNYYYIVKFCVFDCKKKTDLNWAQIYKTNDILVLPKHLFYQFKQDYECDIKILQIWAFKTKKNIFNRFIKKNIIDGKINQNDKLLAKYNKRIANSLSGYLGRNTDLSCNIVKKMQNVFLEQQKNRKINAIYLPAYIAILDKHKAEFIKIIKKYKDDIIYANTDGFLTVRQIRLSELNFNNTSGVGLYKESPPFKKLYIECINGYAGERINGELDCTLSGISMSDKISSEQLASKSFGYTYNIILPDGTVKCNTVDGH